MGTTVLTHTKEQCSEAFEVLAYADDDNLEDSRVAKILLDVYQQCIGTGSGSIGTEKADKTTLTILWNCGFERCGKDEYHFRFPDCIVNFEQANNYATRRSLTLP